MITADYCRLMARYNTWQTQSQLDAADTLDDAARWQDRGAFFGSIARTMNHLYWDDALWLARFSGEERPEDRLAPSLEAPQDWTDFKSMRADRNAEIEAWARLQADADLAGSIGWFPSGGTTRIEKSRALCVAHMFNHQTHHRGQIHAMLTVAGAMPQPTDLPMLKS